MNLVDLHSHSHVSDGLLSPRALVREAARRGLTVIALTDHDTVAGITEALAEAKRQSIELIPGVELSSDTGEFETHILGYFVDHQQDEFIHRLAYLESQRATRIERMVAKLNEIGLPLNLADVHRIAGPGSIGRPHVARAMIERGYVNSINEAFEFYLSVGRRGYVPRDNTPPEDAVRLIRSAGGVPVLAHPYSTGNIEQMLSRLIPAGLLGMEVFYGEYDEGQREHLRAIARRRDLIATGGSDFHGEGHRSGRDLGGPFVPMEAVHQLRAAAAQARREARPEPVAPAAS
jgi:predicted metal-dependent phosphoesterase TrpH